MTSIFLIFLLFNSNLTAQDSLTINHLPKCLDSLRAKNDSTTTLFFHVDKTYKVNLVPVNSTATIDKEKLENELNKIYYPYGVSVSLNLQNKIEDKSWDLNNDGKLNTGLGEFLSRYTDEMNELNYLLKDKIQFDKEAIYLFLLKEASSREIKGDMPIKSQFGYLFGELNYKTIAHEIAHGFFQLKHSFDESIALQKSSTNNLMDYASGNALYKYQWDLVHDKGLMIAKLWQSDSAGRQVENIKSKFKKLKDLRVQLPNELTGENQEYNVIITMQNPITAFNEITNIFKTSPQNILTNFFAKFNAPVDSLGKKDILKIGNFIKIDLTGPMNNCYVKIQNITNIDKYFAVTFVTLEGHTEKGIITFSFAINKENNISFTIKSISEVNYGSIPTSVARFFQKNSWKEVLENIERKLFGITIEKSLTINGKKNIINE